MLQEIHGIYTATDHANQRGLEITNMSVQFAKRSTCALELNLVRSTANDTLEDPLASF
jgi:hypothetical protein